MALSKTLIKVLEHPLVTVIAKVVQKFRHSKSYWSVTFLVLAFTLREAIAANYGGAVKAFTTAQAEGSDYAWLWNVLGFIFGEGGSWVLVSLGFIFFLILSLVKISENKNNTVTLKESFLSLVLLLTIVGISGYSLFNNKTQHEKTHTEQKLTHTKIDELKELIKLQGGDETAFLIKYFGKDYAVILENSQTYHNFTTLLTQSNQTADELLTERETLLKKIASQRFSKKLQQQIDEAFSELRYDDARALMDVFLEANHDTEQAIIKAHYIKALSYMEQIRYHDAKKEFEHIGSSIDDAEILSDYAFMYYTLGEYDKAISFYEKALKISLVSLGKNHPDTATSYNNIGAAWKSKGEYDKAISFQKKALKINLATLGENHPSTAISYNNLGTTWESKDEYDKAISFYEKALKISLATLGENHPDTATSYNNIGSAWYSKGEYDEAIIYFEKAINILRVSFPAGHPYIDITEDSLRSAKENLKKGNK